MGQKLALDFTKINKPGYRVYRVMQSPGIWAKFYQDKIKAARDASDALIFPEQYLSLNQKVLYGVSKSDSDRGVSVSATRIDFNGLYTYEHNNRLSSWDSPRGTIEILSVDDITKFEMNNQDPEDLDRYFMKTPNNRSSIGKMVIFTNPRSAANFARKEIEAGIKGL